MPAKFTIEDARQCFSAINVAESKIGGDAYAALKAKLYSMFPEIRKEHIDAEEEREVKAENQRRERQIVSNMLVRFLDTKLPLIPQIVKWYEGNHETVRKHYSDEICLSEDVWKYHRGIVPQLSKELKQRAKAKGELYYVKQSDTDMWHYLVITLQEARWGIES
jgi:hypothetical protein